MNMAVSKLHVEAIYIVAVLHVVLLIYIGCNGNLFELSVPPHIIEDFNKSDVSISVFISELDRITPLKDPIFYAGIVFIVIFGIVWLRLSFDLPDALERLEKNGMIKGVKNLPTETKGYIMFRRISRALNDFIAKKRREETTYEEFLERLQCALNSRVAYLFGAFGAASYLIYQVKKVPIEQSKTLIWKDYRAFLGYFTIYTAIWVVCFFIIAIMIWKLLQIAIYIRELFKEFEVNIKPFHPDKIGGLKPITQIVVNINLFVFAAGIGLFFVYISYLRERWPHLWCIFAGYIIISTVLFFYPLSSARESMKKSKEEFLNTFSKTLNQEYNKVFKEFKEGGIRPCDEHLSEEYLNQVKALRDFYDQAKKMPVWPFDRDTILTFTSRVLLPIFLVVINMIVMKYLHLSGAP